MCHVVFMDDYYIHMSVTYSPKDLYNEVARIYQCMYDEPLDTNGSYLHRVDECLQRVQVDLGVPLETPEGSACFVLVTRLATVETALFGDTNVVVQDEITVAQCILEAKRIRKRLAKRSRYCPFF